MYKPYLNWIVIVYAIFVIPGCDDTSDGGGQRVGVFYVNPVLGDDTTGDGSKNNQFKTITKTIQYLQDLEMQSDGKFLNTTINLAHGIYDGNSGEIFPLVLPANVNLTANRIDVENLSAALIRGVGSFQSKYVASTQVITIVLVDSSQIRSLVVEAPDGIAVWDEGDGFNNEILNSGIQNSRVALVAVNKASIKVKGTTIQNNQDIGLQFLHESTPSLTENKIINNGIGIVIQDNSKPIFRLKTGEGNNEVTQNLNCDLLHLGNADVNTSGTRWDLDVFNFTISNSCSGGENIVNEGSGAIDYQVIPSPLVLLFNGTTDITLTQPLFGELIITNRPSFKWLSDGNPLSMLVIWDIPPVVNQGRVSNQSNIKWIWHSGLGTGINGAIDYSDGRSLQDGDINNTVLPIPLDPGRSYYWAVWEWNEDGTKIISSSNISYFRVSN